MLCWNARSWHEASWIARCLGVSQSVIIRLWSRLAQTNSTLDQRRSGHPSFVDQFLHTSAFRSRSVSAEQLRERLSRTGTRVSVQTVWNPPYSAGLRARWPYVGVQLSQRNRQARLAWKWQHIDGLTNNGQLYSLPMSHGFCWICLTDDVAFGIAEVRGTRTAPLLNMTGMEKEVLWYGTAYLFIPLQSCLCLTELWQANATSMKYYSLPFVQQHHVVLQDNNARPHRARIVQQFLQQNNVDLLGVWPA